MTAAILNTPAITGQGLNNGLRRALERQEDLARQHEEAAAAHRRTAEVLRHQIERNEQ